MRRVLTGMALAAVAAATAGPAAPSADAHDPQAVRPVQELAALLTPHRVLVAPGGRPARAGGVRASRPITGGQTVLPVTGRSVADGARWLRVRLPGRPNGATGWISQRGTVVTTTGWHVLVRTTGHRVLVYRRGRLVRSFPAIVGKPSTPTPHGRFFVEESVRMPTDSAGAPFALALSARSNVLQEFEGGPGQIAIHGLARVGGTLGTAASHGCVRLDDPSIRWMAAHIAPGVPVTIRS